MNRSPADRRRPLWVTAALIVALFYTAEAVYNTPTRGGHWPSKAMFASFISKLSNATTVIFPDGSSSYQFLSQAASFNLLLSNSPGVIVIPGNEQDLSTAVAFASKHRIHVVPRCSGVDFNGRSTGRDVMLIKTERLNTVTYDPNSQTVTFGSGASHADVYSAMAKVNRVYVGGNFKLVCPAGCLGGGCHSFYSRQYGLGVDNVVEVRITLYNGTIVTATPSSHADLFHAYLGAGHASFGVAASFTARTHPAPPAVLQLDVTLNLTTPSLPAATNNLLSTFFFNTTWFDSLPMTLAGTFKITGPTVTASFLYTGFQSDAFAPLRSLLASPFVVSVASVKNFTSIVTYALAAFPPANEVFVRRFASNVFIPPQQAVLDNLTRLVLDQTTSFSPSYSVWIGFEYGGAVRNGTTGSVPRGMRDAMYEVHLTSKWYDPRDDETYAAQAVQILPQLYSMSTSAYVNEVTSWGGKYNVISDWKTRLYGNYSKLLEVKKSYDPCNFFTVQYSVGSDLPTATDGCMK